MRSGWSARTFGPLFASYLLIWSAVSPDILGSAAEVRSIVQPAQTKAGTHEAMMHMPLVAPLFIQDNEFSSNVVLVNAAGVSTYADLLLSGLDGREITHYRVDFAPHSQRLVQIVDLLASAVSPETTGRVVVMQSPQLTGMPIAAQLSLTYRGDRIPSYIDQEVAMPSAEGSQVLRAVADDEHGSSVVALTSLSETVQHVLIECVDQHAKHFSKSVHLLADETLLTEACSDRTAHGSDFGAVDSPSSSGLHGPVGISLTSDSMPGSFAAFGLARRQQRGGKSLSAVTFFDPGMLPSGTFVFAGVPVGPSALLPKGDYVPRLCLANFAPTDAHVIVKYAMGAGSSATVQDLRSIVVRAGGTELVEFANLPGDTDLQNSFLIGSDAKPGSLLVRLASRNDSGLHDVEILAKDELDPTNAGYHPWSLENGSDSTLLLFNHHSEPESFTVAVSSDQMSWQKIYKLMPMQTEAISLRRLAEDQTKDDLGHAFSKDVLSGQVTWFARTSGIAKGRLLQSSRVLGMARSFSCSGNTALCGLRIIPTTSNIKVGSTVTFGTADTFMCDVTGQPLGTCSVEGDTGTSLLCSTGRCTYGWSASSVASVSSGGSSPTVSLTGVSTGSGTATVNVTDRQTSCQRNASQPLTVISQAIPTDLRIVSESNLNNGSLFFTYAWSSSSGNQADLATCTVGESVFYPNYPSTPFTWPLPMVASPPTPNPTVVSGAGSNAGFTDTNQPPDRYQTPYFATNFNTTQKFWWQCPYYQSGALQSFVPDVTIARRIFKSVLWYYQITKSGKTNTVKLPNQ